MSLKPKTSWVIAGITAVVAAAGKVIHKCRQIGQKNLQKRVDESAPPPVENDLSVVNNIQLTILNDGDFDWASCQESPMSEDESKEWKAFISTYAGEAVKTTVTASAFHGLLKCDVPLKDLCRIKDHPEAVRGFVISNGKIRKHASFMSGLGNATPLLIYQCLAAVTSQYYQQIITEQLNTINTKLDNICKILTSDDRAKLKVAYNRFVELSRKKTYHNGDQQTVSNFSGDVEMVREKYRDLLQIKPFNVNAQLTDKKEAEAKIKALRDSRYLEYLDMAMYAEVLTFIASVVSIKVAKYLGNDEDVDIYLKRMNLDYWNNYVNQFNQIRHDVVNYLERQAKASWVHGSAITEMKDKQINQFNKVEKSMQNLQKQLNPNIVQYIKVQEDGELKKYISVSEA